MKSKNWGRAAAGALAALLLLAGPYALREAKAAWRSMHISGCKLISGSVAYNDAGQIGNDGATNALLLCPLDGDSRVRAWDTSQASVTLYGYSNGANGLQAKVCETFRSGGGGNCAAATTVSPGAGVQIMSLPTTILEPESKQYAYVWVQLAPPSGGSFNVIWGYTLGGP